MEINKIKIIMRKVLEGEFDDELTGLQNCQEYEYGLYIPINSSLAKQVNKIMNERDFSLQDFIWMSFIKISEEFIGLLVFQSYLKYDKHILIMNNAEVTYGVNYLS